MRLSLLLPAVILLTGLVAVTPAMADAGGGPVPVATPSGCPIASWGSLPKSAPGMSPGSIIGIRAGESGCADRIVFTIATNGATPGFRVRYVSQVTQDASGAPVPLRGGARLLIVVNANGHDISTGKSSFRFLPSIRGFRTFTDLKSAGDFEGLASLGLGVRARLPFRAFELPGPGKGVVRIVIDVAHTWR